jgi:hypothetical protein
MAVLGASRFLISSHWRALNSNCNYIRRTTISRRTLSACSTLQSKPEDLRARKDNAGAAARTDKSTDIKYPYDDRPRTEPARGRGGTKLRPTLASFSLAGKTAIVTGGARGLGLVMAQGLMTSGADIALVDMNSEYIGELEVNQSNSCLVPQSRLPKNRQRH